MSNVSESRLHQRKPASNVKLVSVHVSPVYTSSVSELVKPLNVSTPVCSINATKRNVCNVSNVSQFTKSLNDNKPLCSSKVTNRNVCNTSSVIKLIKPLNVSKTVCSNTTGRNVCRVCSVNQLVKPSNRNVRNVNSIKQLVKTFNVTKSVYSSNASSSVSFNSTCEPASNLVSDCQSVKPARELIDVNRKRPHEQLANNKNSRQHEFTKPFSAVNILMMSIYFFELVLLFFISHHNFGNNYVDNFFKGHVRCNNFSANKFLTFNSIAIFSISDKNVLPSSVHFYQFSFSLYEYSFFRNSVFYNIFNVNSVTNILNNDFCRTIYLTGIIGFYFAIIKWQGSA